MFAIFNGYKINKGVKIKHFCFISKYWKDGFSTTIVLNRVFRQTNRQWIKMLNQMNDDNRYIKYQIKFR